jgi:hypothetical protein
MVMDNRPYLAAKASELRLELHLRRGPRFQCQTCRSLEDAPGRFDTCPSCGMKGALCGSFVRDETSPQWKLWEKRTFERYRQQPNDQAQARRAEGATSPAAPSCARHDQQEK